MTLTLFQSRQSQTETSPHAPIQIQSSVRHLSWASNLPTRSNQISWLQLTQMPIVWVLQSLITAITCCFPATRWVSCLWTGFLPWLKSVARNPRIRWPFPLSYPLLCPTSWHVLAALRCAVCSRASSTLATKLTSSRMPVRRTASSWALRSPTATLLVHMLAIRTLLLPPCFALKWLLGTQLVTWTSTRQWMPFTSAMATTSMALSTLPIQALRVPIRWLRL